MLNSNIKRFFSAHYLRATLDESVALAFGHPICLALDQCRLRLMGHQGLLSVNECLFQLAFFLVVFGDDLAKPFQFLAIGKLLSIKGVEFLLDRLPFASFKIDILVYGCRGHCLEVGRGGRKSWVVGAVAISLTLAPDLRAKHGGRLGEYQCRTVD